jgi:hypothetical protein
MSDPNSELTSGTGSGTRFPLTTQPRQKDNEMIRIVDPDARSFFSSASSLILMDLADGNESCFLS